MPKIMKYFLWMKWNTKESYQIKNNPKTILKSKIIWIIFNIFRICSYICALIHGEQSDLKGNLIIIRLL